ncbi:hypothetical protein [Alteribacter aurantiacus]|uniref:hypothetical protein n=1 Tax=Alteribacter aurantiacus TaxID=254410 RepID=UPI0004064715|nr:hypothetical protein [Alteribacter aurantiacus]
MAVLIILLICGLGLWVYFKYELKETKMLGTGLARKNGFKRSSTGGTVQCDRCSKQVKMGETAAYCDRCQRYI